MSTATGSVRRALAWGAAVSFVVFLVVAEQVLTDGPFITFDHHVMDRFAHRHLLETLIHFRPLAGRAVRVARVISLSGDIVFVLALAVGAGVVLLVQRRWRSGWFVIAAIVGGAVLNVVTRVGVAHLRPTQPFPFQLFGYYGMPSGHTMDVTIWTSAILIALWPMLSPLARTVAVAAAAVLVPAVAVSRLVLLAHQLSDVVGGIALGLAWVLALAAVLAPWEDYVERGEGASASIW